MPQFRDFQAAVVVDEVELPEYTIEVNEEGDKVSCYIPSEVGKNFAVRWKDMNLQRSTVGKVYLDGAFAARRSITKSNPREASASHCRVTSETVRPYCFELLSLTDDESYANPAENNLGEVRIELYEVLSRKKVPFPPDWKPNCVPGVVRIHEHSKKMMMHCVGYGADTKIIRKKRRSHFKKGKRLAIFVFRYQALDMLQAQGIAPPPVPGPSTKREKKRQRCKEEDTIDIIVIDDGEADEARLKALKAEIGEIEARLLKRPKTVVKLEVKSENKAPVIANREVIELE